MKITSDNGTQENRHDFFSATRKIDQSTSIQKKLAELEASSKGRIGVYAISMANNTHLGYRANKRFPTGCTSKVIGVATILNKSMNDWRTTKKALANMAASKYDVSIDPKIAGLFQNIFAFEITESYHISFLAVSKAFRGKGLGRKLLEYAMQGMQHIM